MFFKVILLGTRISAIVIKYMYYRHLSKDIKMENYKIKTSFVSPKEPKTWD